MYTVQMHKSTIDTIQLFRFVTVNIDILCKYALTSWSFRQGLFGLCMPSVFGIDDNYELKPWEEGQAFQRSEQPQIQRGPMIHTPQGPQVF